MLRPNECIFEKVGKALVFVAAAKKSIANKIFLHLTYNSCSYSYSYSYPFHTEAFERHLRSIRATVHGYTIYHA